MDIRELKYLYEISQCESMEKAAGRLYITQPSLTKAVKKMEEELGFKLFEKVGRKNVLTLAGKQVINWFVGASRSKLWCDSIVSDAIYFKFYL